MPVRRQKSSTFLHIVDWITISKRVGLWDDLFNGKRRKRFVNDDLES